VTFVTSFFIAVRMARSTFCGSTRVSKRSPLRYLFLRGN